MAPSNLPPSFNATSKDIEDLLAAQAHLGSKNLQTHMEPYVWKTRPDGINIINIGKTWYVNDASLDSCPLNFSKPIIRSKSQI
jgi:small subunit ribosomal protein SAe